MSTMGYLILEQEEILDKDEVRLSAAVPKDTPLLLRLNGCFYMRPRFFSEEEKNNLNHKHDGSPNIRGCG